tara:strand:- start:435 stop:725 length:291 start_codon:yes stop_codon:yes gene_type:complete
MARSTEANADTIVLDGKILPLPQIAGIERSQQAAPSPRFDLHSYVDPSAHVHVCQPLPVTEPRVVGELASVILLAPTLSSPQIAGIERSQQAAPSP